MKTLFAIFALSLSSLAQHVQHCTSATANTNPSCTLPSPVTVGNKLIAIIMESDNLAAPYPVTDTLGHTFTSPGGSGTGLWTIGFFAAQCGGGADGRNNCYAEIYSAPITSPGSDTITYVSGGNTPDVYWLYVGEYSGIGSFDVANFSCSGGQLFPCTGPLAGGSQSVSVATSTTNSFLFVIAACDKNTSIGAPGCNGAPTNSTGTFRAGLNKSGGCCGLGMQEIVFDSMGGPPGTYTQTADFGVPTNFIINIWAFGFTASTRVNHRSLWK